MTIREYAKQNDHEIIGKLTRQADIENTKYYIDEAGNEYYASKKSICIITAEGAVI